MSILHIARAAEWQRAQATGEYRWSSRDRTVDDEGFIHCSTPGQVAGVAARFYADDVEPLAVLVLDDEAIAASATDLVYEGDGELFPHIYGPIRLDWVTEVRPASFLHGEFVY